MWKQLTKQTIFVEKDVYREVLLSNFRIDPYVICISHRNKKLYISYRSIKFSLDDLQSIKLPEGYHGGKGQVILGNCPYLKYSFKNGFNIYTVDFGGQIAAVDRFSFKIKVKNPTSQMGKVILDLIKLLYDYKETGVYDEWSNVVNELLSNILFHTNMIEQYIQLTANSVIFRWGDLEREVFTHDIRKNNR